MAYKERLQEEIKEEKLRIPLLYYMGKITRVRVAY